MKNKLLFLVINLTIYFPCFSQIQAYQLDDDSIIVEKFDISNRNENRFTENNKIYKENRTFTYSYYYENYLQQKFVYAKDVVDA